MDREVFGHLNLKRQEIIKNIIELYMMDDESDLNDEKKEERNNMFSELQVLSHKQEALWRQKLIAKWINKVDSNFKYFHLVVKWRRNKNEIKGVQTLGKLCEKPDILKEVVKDYFKERLMKSTASEIRLGKV